MHQFQKKILINQFADFKQKQIKRIKKSEIYYGGLKNLKQLFFPQIEFNDTNIFLEFPIICENKKIKDDLFNYLMKNNIDVKGYYYKNCSDETIYNSLNQCINSRSISQNIIMLPVHEKINANYQAQIINHIVKFISKYS